MQDEQDGDDAMRELHVNRGALHIRVRTAQRDTSR
jgi:hypothetical protein